MQRYAARTCEECGAEYLPKQHNQRRCSGACTDKYRSRRSAQRRVDRRRAGCTCGTCSACAQKAGRNEYARAWYRANRMRIKLAQYGMSAEDFARMVEDQDGRCAICGALGDDDVHGRLVPDHDHACCPTKPACGKCVRGLLCVKCNTAIAMLEDDPFRARAAAEYLEGEG